MRPVVLLLSLAVTVGSAAAPGNPEVEFIRIRQNAENGDIRAQQAIAEMYLSGNGTPADPAAAIEWLEKAARSGDRESMKRLGDVQLNGNVRDPAAAATWYRLAAEHGHVPAQVALAALLQTDELGIANLREAYAWLRLAVEDGADPSGMERLAELLTEDQRRSAEMIVESLRARMRDRMMQKIAEGA